MYSRYAIYVVPDGVWGDFGASWLGWDNRTGAVVGPQDEAQILLTNRPRKYGFHGTIKPPFRMAHDQTESALVQAAQNLCADLRPITLARLELTQIGSFFAMTAPDDHAALRSLSDPVVTQLDTFRAPLTEAELARRRRSRLTPEQDVLLKDWGYPFVLDAFKFHLTLTGPVQDSNAARSYLEQALTAVAMPRFTIDSLAILGERPDSYFEVIERIPLLG